MGAGQIDPLFLTDAIELVTGVDELVTPQTEEDEDREEPLE